MGQIAICQPNSASAGHVEAATTQDGPGGKTRVEHLLVNVRSPTTFNGPALHRQALAVHALGLAAITVKTRVSRIREQFLGALDAHPTCG